MGNESYPVILALIRQLVGTDPHQDRGVNGLLGVGADQLTDQRQDDRLAHRPLAREDRTLLVGRELRQTQEGISAAAPPTPAPDSPRVRAQELLREDRARVKREAALAD